MTDVFRYMDVVHYRTVQTTSSRPLKSNLCSRYFADRRRFCGNYCSRYRFDVSPYHRRCWRHIRRRGTGLPPVVLLMIVSSDRIFNKSRWLHFIDECERNNVPIELVVDEANMYNCTVHRPSNFISRFRPIPELYPYVRRTLHIQDSHARMNHTTVYTDMLTYGSAIPHAVCCIVITERTFPIRSPMDIYRTATDLTPKCALPPSYYVRFHADCPPSTRC